MAPPRRSTPDPKQGALAPHGSLHPHPESVRDALFQESDFFDPRDQVQVKYEMLRRVHADGASVSATARDFGFSRLSFYQARTALSREGVEGLLPKRRGPKGGHKLTAEVLDFLAQVRADTPGLGAKELAERVLECFGLRVHPRSIERVLARRGKPQRRTG
jgi:transposase